MAIVQGTRLHILEALAHEEGPEGLTLRELAERLGLADPTILSHLRRLKDEDLMGRAPKQRLDGKRYRAPHVFTCLWIDPRRGLLDQWTAREDDLAHPVFDLRFPLITRVPDTRGRRFLHEWLDRADARGLLPATIPIHETRRPRPPTLLIGVFGSCVRGQANDKSDLDIVLYQNRAWKGAGAIVDLAHEILVESPHSTEYRPLDVQNLVGPEAIRSLAPVLRARLATECRTVHSNHPASPLLEEMFRPDSD